MELTRNNLRLPFDCNMLSFFFFGSLALIISDHDDQILLSESGPNDGVKGIYGTEKFYPDKWLKFYIKRK